MRLCRLQSVADQVQVGLRRGNAARALLLEAMKNIHRVLESNGVHGAVGAPRLILDHFQHAGRAKALEWLRLFVLLAGLRQVKGLPERVLHILGHPYEVFLGRGDPDQRFQFLSHAEIIPIWA